MSPAASASSRRAGIVLEMPVSLERPLVDEILCGRPRHLKVFVSSKMRGGVLAVERGAAVEAIDTMPWYRAWAWERDAAPGPYSAWRVCVGHAKTSDVLVLLLSDDLSPITRKEYRAAKRAGVPRLVLLKAGSSRSDAAEHFVITEQRSSITAEFANLAELRTQVLQGLQSYALRAHRESILAARKLGR
jgi:hypothetical protein